MKASMETIIDNLNEEEIKLVLEALLFSCSADICAKWNEEDTMKLLDIAVKIKRNTFCNRDSLLNGNLEIMTGKNADNLAKVNIIRTFFDLSTLR